MAPRARVALAVAAAAVFLRSDAVPGKVVVRSDYSGPLALAPVAFEFTNGEKLVYEIGWSAGEKGGFMPAGRASLEARTRPGGLVELLMCASSNWLVDRIYRVRDEATSLADGRRGCSVLFELNKDERRRKSWERVVFDHSSMAARSVKRKRDGGPGRSRAALEGPVLDALSSVYYIRAAGVGKGKVFRLPVFQDGKVWELQIELGEAEEVELPEVGRFRAYRAKPEVHFPGLFEKRGELVLWLEERTGIVLKALAELPVGSAELRLTGVENSPLVPRSSAGP